MKKTFANCTQAQLLNVVLVVSSLLIVDTSYASDRDPFQVPTTKQIISDLETLKDKAPLELRDAWNEKIAAAKTAAQKIEEINKGHTDFDWNRSTSDLNPTYDFLVSQSRNSLLLSHIMYRFDVNHPKYHELDSETKGSVFEKFWSALGSNEQDVVELIGRNLTDYEKGQGEDQIKIRKNAIEGQIHEEIINKRNRLMKDFIASFDLSEFRREKIVKANKERNEETVRKMQSDRRYDRMFRLFWRPFR